MARKTLLGLVVTGILLSAAGSVAAKDDGADGEPHKGQPEEESPILLTGLDFSYWASEEENTYGPGLSWGLILVPRMLEMQLAVGAMLGSQIYTIPIELRFSVPFALASWVDLVVAAGPTLLFDRVASTWEHDFAASASLGFELKPPGFDWGIRLLGDYGLRFWKEVVHTGGFTVGFLYRF